MRDNGCNDGANVRNSVTCKQLGSLDVRLVDAIFRCSGAFSRGMRESIDPLRFTGGRARADKLRGDGEANSRTAMF